MSIFNFDKNFTWTEFKNEVQSRSLQIQWIQKNDVYFLRAFDNFFYFESVVDITSPRNTDQIDFEDNFQSGSNQTPNLITHIRGGTDNASVGNIGDQLNTSDVLNNGGVDAVLSIVSGVPQELKVGASKLANRKWVIINPLDTQLRFGFSNSTQNIRCFKSQHLMLPVGDSTEIWFDADSGTRDVAIAEIS